MTHLNVGDKAPNFSVKNQNGELVNLSDYQNNKLVLFFYPKASTPGCTVEAKNLRDHLDKLEKIGYKVLGVSADSEKRQKIFCDKNELPYPLLADEDKVVINAYGVWGPKKFMGKEYEGIHRMTFLIDKQGFISHIIKKVKTKEHADQILNLIESESL